jgi:hypothetical protein
MNMKEELDKKRLFAFLILGILLLSFSLTVVGAQTKTTTITDKAGNVVSRTTEKIEGWLSKIDGWDIAGISATGIIGTIILGMIIFIVLSNLPKIEDNKTLCWILSFGLAALFMLTVRPEELYGITISFKSITLALLTLIPLAALFWFSTIIEMGYSVWVKVFLKFFWIIYFLYMGAQAILAGILEGKFEPITWVVFGVQVATTVFVFIGGTKWMARWVAKQEGEEAVNAAKAAGSKTSMMRRAGEAFAREVKKGS